MWRTKPDYFPNKALFKYLDLLYEYHSNNKINLENTYIIVDFDKTLIIKDALFQLIFISFFLNGLKYLSIVINQLFQSIGQIDKIDDLKIWLKYSLSISIVKSIDKAVLKKIVLKLFYKYKRDNLFKRLQKFNYLGIKILVATNNYEYFLKDLMEDLNFELVGNQILNLNDSKKYTKDKVIRIKEYLDHDRNILASISDSLVDKKMLELGSNKIFKDYELKLFFTIKTQDRLNCDY